MERGPIGGPVAGYGLDAIPFVATTDRLVQAVERLADAWEAHLRQRGGP